jgi:hypothetical protein
MTEPNRAELENHWDSLAELLGLPPEPKPAPPPPPEETPTEKDHTQEAEPQEIPKAGGRSLESEAVEPAERDAHRGRHRWAPFGEEEPEELAPLHSPEQPAEITAPEVAQEQQAAVEPEETEPEEKESRSGGRRGRRSGKGRSSRSASAEGEGEETQAEPEAEKTDRARRRGRGRSRQSRSRSTEAETAEAVDREGAEEEPDLKDEDLDTLSDWNVPSWAELIASLYRPER